MAAPAPLDARLDPDGPILRSSRPAAARMAVTVLAAAAALAGTPTRAQGAPPIDTGGACNRTTDAIDDACEQQARADRSLALAVCANLASTGERTRCVRQANRRLSSAPKDCEAQEEARRNVCRALGQAPYDPVIRPSDFTTRITHPFLPLQPGTVLTYRSKEGSNTVTVTHRTVTILGVRCVVVRDTAVEDGEVQEDTEDYYAQDRAGNVWYFGEATAAFEGGVPVSNAGAWIAGVAGAKPGIIMPAMPRPGLTYRQEFALGAAEDVGRVEALGQGVRVPFGRFSNALQTFEFTPLEPEVKENKFYVPGVGQVLAVDLETGAREELVSIKRGR